MSPAVFRLMLMREAIASVSLSHRLDCTCDICEASRGDEDAFTRVMLRVEDFKAEHGIEE